MQRLVRPSSPPWRPPWCWRCGEEAVHSPPGTEGCRPHPGRRSTRTGRAEKSDPDTSARPAGQRGRPAARSESRQETPSPPRLGPSDERGPIVPFLGQVVQHRKHVRDALVRSRPALLVPPGPPQPPEVRSEHEPAPRGHKVHGAGPKVRCPIPGRVAHLPHALQRRSPPPAPSPEDPRLDELTTFGRAGGRSVCHLPGLSSIRRFHGRPWQRLRFLPARSWPWQPASCLIAQSESGPHRSCALVGARRDHSSRDQGTTPSIQAIEGSSRLEELAEGKLGSHRGSACFGTHSTSILFHCKQQGEHCS
mmetsp:Transcript_7149/g.16367  ORF Transcript_7149/g.16367 Transcript_7149/m.16367 type:complete len:307 (-) Transcript_7149:244-1164(-)